MRYCILSTITIQVIPVISQLPVTQEPNLIGEYLSATGYEENQRRVYWNQFEGAAQQAEQEATNYHIWRNKRDFIIRGSEFFPDGVTRIQGNENPDSVKVNPRTPEYFGNVLMNDIYDIETSTPPETFRQGRIKDGVVYVKKMTEIEDLDEEYPLPIGTGIDFRRQMIWWNTNQLSTYVELIKDSVINLDPRCDEDLSHEDFTSFYVNPHCKDTCSCFFTSTQEKSCISQCSSRDLDSVLSCEFNRLLFKVKRLILENKIDTIRETMCVEMVDESLLGLTVTEVHPLGLDGFISIGTY